MLRLAMIAALAAAPAIAQQDFSEGSEAKEWGLYGEQKALFTATVADPLCELAGDCSDNCGAGDRQLVLVREADDVMLLVMKNVQTQFNGGVEDLIEFCGQKVEVDGLVLEDEELGSTNLFQVQRVRAEGGEWRKADRWTDAWKEANPDVAEGKGPWFRRDPRVQAEIEAEGFLGLGADADAAFIAEEYGE